MSEHIRISSKGVERFPTEAAYTRARDKREKEAARLEAARCVAGEALKTAARNYNRDRYEQDLRAAYIAGEIDVDDFVAAVEEL